jgi:Zn-dependent alcohol dehydrogenase
VTPGSTVAVIGCGGVGLSVIQGARIAGASLIIGLDTNEFRLGVAEAVGATTTADTSKVSIVDAVDSCVRGGADFVFEAVGHPDLMSLALEASRPGGTAVIIGTPQGPRIDLDARTMFYNRKLIGTLAGSSLPGRDITRIVDLYRAGLLQLDEMITDRLPLERALDGLQIAKAGEAARVLVTIDP